MLCCRLLLRLFGSMLILYERYSEFDELRDKLLHSFPKAKHSIPQLPPKSALCE